MKTSILRLALLWFGFQAAGLAAVARPVPAPSPPASEALNAAQDRYRTCAALSLPENFAVVAHPRMAAAKALDRCQNERLALAGQYALDNPGSRRTADFVDGVRERLVNDLAGWIVDMKSLGVEGPR